MGAEVAGGDQDLASSGQQQVALGLAAAGGEPAVRVGERPPAAALEVLQGQRLVERAAEGLAAGQGGDTGGGGVEADDPAGFVGDDQAVGQVVGVDAEPPAMPVAVSVPGPAPMPVTASMPGPSSMPVAASVPGSGGGGGCEACGALLRACAGLSVPTVIPVIPPLRVTQWAPSASPY